MYHSNGLTHVSTQLVCHYLQPQWLVNKDLQVFAGNTSVFQTTSLATCPPNRHCQPPTRILEDKALQIAQIWNEVLQIPTTMEIQSLLNEILQKTGSSNGYNNNNNNNNNKKKKKKKKKKKQLNNHNPSWSLLHIPPTSLPDTVTPGGGFSHLHHSPCFFGSRAFFMAPSRPPESRVPTSCHIQSCSDCWGSSQPVAWVGQDFFSGFHAPILSVESSWIS